MSERIVPAKPGWWWVKISDDDADDAQCVRVFNDIDGSLIFNGGGSRGFVRASSSIVTWLAPVPPSEAVAAAVEVLKGYEHAARLARDQQGVDEIKRAIAGLTGGEVG